ARGEHSPRCHLLRHLAHLVPQSSRTLLEGSLDQFSCNLGVLWFRHFPKKQKEQGRILVVVGQSAARDMAHNDSALTTRRGGEASRHRRRPELKRRVPQGKAAKQPQRECAVMRSGSAAFSRPSSQFN